MSQVLTAKRLRIAGNVVASGTAILDASSGLKAAALEKLQAGNFVDAELATVDLQQTTAFMLGLVTDTLSPDIEAFLDAKVGGNNANPTRRELLLQLRK